MDCSSNYEGQSIPCRCSRGWTDYRPGETAEELMKRADAALYADKRAAKPKTHVLTGPDSDNSVRLASHEAL